MLCDKVPIPQFSYGIKESQLIKKKKKKKKKKRLIGTYLSYDYILILISLFFLLAFFYFLFISG